MVIRPWVSGKWLAADRDFLKFWTGQAISQIGSRITREGLPLTAVLVLGAAPRQMGYLSGASAAAILIFGLFAGAWADRVRRRPILIAADLGRGLLLATIPIAAAAHRLTMGQLYLVAALTGILTVCFDVSYQAYVPSLVPDHELLESNARLTLTESVAEIAGPSITGILVQAITAPLAILFDALSFFASAISIAWIGRCEPPPAPAPAPHLGREISEGLRFAVREPTLRALLRRTFTAAFFLGFISSLYIVFAIRVLGLTPAILGGIISIGGVSSLFGALLAARIARRFGAGRAMIGSALVSGISVLLLPLAHGPRLLCAAFLALSQSLDMAWAAYSINELTLRQQVTPGPLLGRVNSAMHLMFQGIVPLGALIGGVLAESIGIRTTMLIGGCGFLLSSLWLIFSPVRHAA